MEREGSMGDIGEWLGDVKEELFDAGLSQEDYNDALDFINLLEDEAEE